MEILEKYGEDVEVTEELFEKYLKEKEKEEVDIDDDRKQGIVDYLQAPKKKRRNFIIMATILINYNNSIKPKSIESK